MSDDTTTSSTPNPNAFATFKAFLDALQPSERVSEAKLYDLAKKGEFPVYRLPGKKPAYVRFGEARAALARLSSQGKIRRGYGSFGPDAVVRDLSNVAGQDFEVLS